MFRGLIALLGLMALFAAPLGAQTAPSEPATIANRLVEGLIQGDFVGASENFDDTVRTALPPDKLEAAWKQLVAQAGRFQRRLGTSTRKTQQAEAVAVTCAFEKANVDIKVAINAQNRVVGLFFAPAAASQS